MTEVGDADEAPSELDDYFHGFHAAKQSIALTREFFDQRHEYLLEAISSPRGSPKKVRKREDSKKKSKSKEKHRDKHQRKRKQHKNKKERKDKKRASNKHKHKNKKKKKTKPTTIRDEVSAADNTYYAPLEMKEKGWRKHQSIATSAAIANQYETAPSSNKKHKGNKRNHEKKQTATKLHNAYVDYNSDSDDFGSGVIDIADFAKQMMQKETRHHCNEKKKTKKQSKKEKKKEKKRLERERKRKEREIEEIERKMYQKPKANEVDLNKKEFKFAYKPKYRSSGSGSGTGTYTKPSLITKDDKNEVVRLNNSQTSPATAAAFTFDHIPNISAAATTDQVIDTEDFHIVVVGTRTNISPSATPSAPNMPPNLPEPPSSQAPLCHKSSDSSGSSSSCSSSSSSSSSDESEINLDDVVISEMAPSPSSAPTDAFEQQEDHMRVPSMALSLIGYVQDHARATSLQQSPFFDPNFWNNDFKKRKQERKRHFTENLSRIDIMDYVEDDIESDVNRQQTVAHHAKTMTKMKLKRFAKKEMFIQDINSVFHPKYNKKWIKALNGNDDENVLHLVDDKTHSRKSTMAHWENFDNQNVTKQSIKNGNNHISLVPQLIHFSKTFFESKEALFIFRLVKQGIETLVMSEDHKITMVEQLHLAFEREFDRTTYKAPKYTQLQILEKQIVWVSDVKDKLKDNPFLSQQAFDSATARSDYLDEFKSQLDEESMELFNQHCSLAKQEQARASRASRTSYRRSTSHKSNDTQSTKKGKKKRLFGWFRRNKKSNQDKGKDEEKEKEKSTPTTANYKKCSDAEKDKLPQVTMDYYSLYFILLCLLLRHYNHGRNFLVFTISSTSIRITELGDKILDIFGIMTKCGNIYRILCYLKICSKVLSTEASYFDDVLQRLADIKEYLDDDQNKLMTLREKLHLKKVITRMSNWCKLCITRYQHIFFGATGPRALKSCLRCWKFCFSMLYTLNHLDIYDDEFERKWCEKVKDIVKKSVFDYEFPRLVQLYKENSTGGNGTGPSFFFSKQTYNKQYEQFNKMKAKLRVKEEKKKRKSITQTMSEFSKKLISQHSKKKNGETQATYQGSVDSSDSSNSSVYMDSPVDDATQLIMVIKGCRKYLVLDEEEYESAFKSYCTLKQFSLLKITSAQYMTLAFSFTNLYLRVLAFGIEEKIEERRLNLEFAAKTYGDNKRQEEQQNMNTWLENTDFEVDPSVWALYQELKRFYDDLKRIYKTLRKRKIHAVLPEVHYADHYNDIIAYWCQYQGIKFTNPYNGYCAKLTSNETWKKISQNALYSTSVIDLFTLIDPLQHWFLNLPYTNENLLNFAHLLTSIVQCYVNTLHEKITKYLLKELEKRELAFYSKKKEHKMVVWNFPMKLMIAINDIIMAKTQLQQTISKLMLDRRYTQIDKRNMDEEDRRSKNKRKRTIEHTSLARYHTLKQTMLLPPELDLNSTHVAQDSGVTATTFYKHKILPSEFNYNYFDEEDDIQVWNSLNCVDAFQTINRSLSNISFLVGQGLNSDISHEVFLLLWENEKFPPNMPLKKEQVEDELMDMLWKKLCTKCDLLHENISPLFTPYILTDFFSLICADFIKLLIPKREKYVLNLNQLTRVEFAINEIQNFLLDCYNIEPVLVTQSENLYRLKHILNLQLSGSTILINHHKELSTDQDWAELYQLDDEPFVGPKALWLIIKHRSKHHKQDQQLVAYHEEHSGIKAQFKSFTKAVRNRWG